MKLPTLRPDNTDTTADQSTQTWTGRNTLMAAGARAAVTACLVAAPIAAVLAGYSILTPADATTPVPVAAANDWDRASQAEDLAHQAVIVWLTTPAGTEPPVPLPNFEGSRQPQTLTWTRTAHLTPTGQAGTDWAVIIAAHLDSGTTLHAQVTVRVTDTGGQILTVPGLVADPTLTTAPGLDYSHQVRSWASH